MRHEVGFTEKRSIEIVISLFRLEEENHDDGELTEAKKEKLRYLEEVYSAQRKVNDLQSHLKILESKLAEKDSEIRLLQDKKSKNGKPNDIRP